MHRLVLRLLALVLAVASLGCTTKVLPRGARIIERVDVIGAEKVEGSDVEKRLATLETERVLGGLLENAPLIGVIDRLTVQYHTFDRFVLDRDLERVRRFYRARGFYDVEVLAGRVVELPGGQVRVEIVVNEGEPVLIRSVELEFPEWAQAMSANVVMRDVVNGMRSEPTLDGEPLPRFDEQRYDDAKNELLRALTDNGHAYATVRGHVSIDLAARRATVRISATAGPHCDFGEVKLLGLGEIPESAVRRTLGFEQGDPFSTAKIVNARRALGDFGVFGSIDVDVLRSEKGAPPITAIPVIIHVRPIKLRAVKLGVGAGLGSQFEAHAVVGWEDRNFLGGLRRLSIETRPGLVLFPTSVSNLAAPTEVLPEARLVLNFTQPGFPEARSNTHISAGLRLYSPDSVAVPDEVPDDYNILGYRELNGAVGVDRRFHLPHVGGSIYLGQFVKLRFDDPFSYSPQFDDPPDGYERVLLPYLNTVASWDLRKNMAGEPDKVRPRQGVFAGLDVQVAALGDSDDVRLRPELRAYVPITDDVTIALRWASGYLFAFGEKPLGVAPADSEPGRARYLQLLSFRGFYGGGPNSNRGYGAREVGPHALLPFASQFGQSDELLPTGGFGMWELSGELRLPLTDTSSLVLFTDSSDVVSSLDQFRLTHPHISPGVGFRYFTPVGPLRFDVGWRIPYLQRLGEESLEPEEGGPQPGESDGFPLGVSIAIGEAY